VGRDKFGCNAFLSLDVPTRWNLAYTILDVTEKYKREGFWSYAREGWAYFSLFVWGWAKKKTVGGLLTTRIEILFVTL